MYRRGPPRTTPANVQCQKCLKRGHYSYECKISQQDRPYKARPSRTQQLRNPKLAPKLHNEAPPEQRAGVADAELAKREAERAKKRQRDGRGSRSRSRTGSASGSASDSESGSDSDSEGGERVTGPHKAREKNDAAKRRKRSRSFSGSRSASVSGSESGASASRSVSRSPAPRDRSRSPSQSQTRRTQTRTRTRSPLRSPARAPTHAESRLKSSDFFDKSDQAAPEKRDGRNRTRRDYQNTEKGRHADPDPIQRREYRQRDSPERLPEPPAQAARERSLSPFSKRVALSRQK